ASSIMVKSASTGWLAAMRSRKCRAISTAERRFSAMAARVSAMESRVISVMAMPLITGTRFRGRRLSHLRLPHPTDQPITEGAPAGQLGLLSGAQRRGGRLVRGHWGFPFRVRGLRQD